MYPLQRNRPNPSANAARLAAEAAFSAPPPQEKQPEPVSNALIVVKKKRSLEFGEGDTLHHDAHADDANRTPRVFRVPTAVISDLQGHGADGHVDTANAMVARSNGADASNGYHDIEPLPAVQRRARRTSQAKSGPVVTIVTAPARDTVDLAALARELQATATAREHAAAQAQLGNIQAQMTALDEVLDLIAKARAFTLNDMQLSDRWQQLDQDAKLLSDSLSKP